MTDAGADTTSRPSRAHTVLWLLIAATAALLGVLVTLVAGLLLRDPAPERERQTAAALSSFRAQAAEDFLAAIRRHGSDALARRVAARETALWPVSPPRVGWSWLVSTAVPAVAGGAGDRPLTALYNPWADVLLVAEWRRGERRLELVDLDVAPADCARRRGRPPFAMERAWVRRDRFPAAALQETAGETVRAFEQTFAAGAEGTPWRARLAPGGDEAWNEVWRPAAGLLCGRALLAISEYRHPERGEPALLTALRPELDKALGDARAGRGEARPRPGLVVASILVGRTRAYAFAIDTRRPADGAVAFSFDAKGGRLPLSRRDAVDLPGSLGPRARGRS
jgi:hypothetical protein